MADHETVRAHRRALARAHHPDLGGDAAEFVRLMAELDRADTSTRPVGPVAPVTVIVRRRHPHVHRMTRAARQLSRRVRDRLPRSVPGARRFAHYSTHLS